MAFQYPENIVVAGWMFCKKHGREYCYDFKCTCDHRMCNNTVADLDNVFQEEIEESGFSLDDRTSLNVYELGATGVAPGSEQYMCSEHRKKDCPVCFDWAAIVGREIAEEEQREKWLEKRQKYLERVDKD
ncbi:hypothetical protein OBBRIDRAFT_364003 [Obba rivulosa]|uniref:Uncharacterized protein n=1 Tax=Obba rivulosa TaxID=1052685 RepID=A0A8E2J6X7_9APHY|nr:hypothetical protein OBBRIDRAFT_364003 [Obba rivulosa]